MMLKRTKLTLASAAVAVAIPATFALSQGQGQSGAQQGDRQQQQQDQDRARTAGQLNGAMQPGQDREKAQKWFEHAASANQFEIEAARLAHERFGGGQQPGQGMGGMGNDPAQRPGQGTGAGDRSGQGAGAGDRSGQGSGLGDRSGTGQGAGMGQDRDRPGMAGHGMQQQHQKLGEIAQMVLTDHEQALQELRQRAQAAGVEISETPELNPVHRAKLDELRQKQGEEFARAWVFGNMASHTYSILEYSWASQNGPSQEIQQYARQQLPKIQQHAQQIAPVAYEISGVQDARTAGERMDENRPQQPGQQPGQGAGDRSGSGLGGGGSDRPDDN